MNSWENELFEAELRKLTPAKPPADFMAKLASSLDSQQRVCEAPTTRSRRRKAPLIFSMPSWWRALRWLAPAAAVGAAAVVLVCWQWSGPPGEQHAKPSVNPPATAAKSALKADDVEIDQRLVSAFDAVAQLPSGQSVRFRCREWADALVLRDSASGIVIEQRTPRLEVVPVSLETY